MVVRLLVFVELGTHKNKGTHTHTHVHSATEPEFSHVVLVVSGSAPDTGLKLYPEFIDSRSIAHQLHDITNIPILKILPKGAGGW